ncbi:MAG: helix-turn-helix transcriptional regulator [Spirochaetales bacterium]|nr:helix-turn-helix transcriptional regulator [Spirochaetales bacterium]
MATYIGKWEDIVNKAIETPEYQADKIAFQIAIRIGELLDETNISRRDLAKKLKVSKSYVTQILQGVNNMTILTLCKIASALNVEAAVELRETEREYLTMPHFDYQDIINASISSFTLEKTPEYLNRLPGVEALGTAECTVTRPEYKTNILEAV